jgi:PAS domain S-box-containing protein
MDISFIIYNPLLLVNAVVLVSFFLIGVSLARKNKKLEIQEIAINYMVDGLIIIDERKKVRDINPKAKEILGVKEGIINKNVFSKKSKDPYFKNLVEVVSVMKEKGKTEWKVINIEEPEKRVIRVTPIPIFDEKGKWKGYIFILFDMTREKELDLIKSEFITIIGHKFNTPLSEIKWGIQLLMSEKETLSSDQVSLLEKSYKANERIVSQIKTFMQASEIEQGRFKYNFKFELLEDIVADVCGRMAKLAEAKHVSFRYQEPSGSLPKVKIDKEKIGIALEGIIDNALTYSPKEGRVLVSVNKQGNFLLVSVKDNGIGIPESERKKVFTKFFRGNKAYKVYTEG